MKNKIYGESFTQEKPKERNPALQRIDEQKANKERIQKLGHFLKEERKVNKTLTRRLREAEAESARLREYISKMKNARR